MSNFSVAEYFSGLLDEGNEQLIAKEVEHYFPSNPVYPTSILFATSLSTKTRLTFLVSFPFETTNEDGTTRQLTGNATVEVSPGFSHLEIEVIGAIPADYRQEIWLSFMEVLSKEHEVTT